jgi:PKHD-type hydroxylase
MKGEWCYFKSYFSKEYCNRVISLAEQIPFGDSAMGVANAVVNTDYRRSKTKFINQSHWFLSFLFDDLWKCALRANDDFFGFHLSKLDYIQLAKYSDITKDEYKEHHDVFWMNNDPTYHRKLSVIVQLTDPTEYTGGDFELTNTDTKPNALDLRQQGSVIVFPSFFLHKANPVLSGTRYSLAAWFDGPKWR